MNKKIPISIICGFLGCGKTTFINKIISEFPDKKIGVIVNEFGEVPVESQFINNDENQIVELNSGCMCCIVRKDIISAVEDILEKNPELDYILVEASGLSDPIPVAQTFIHNDLNGKIELDAIINLIDVSSFMGNFAKFNIIAQQTKLANFVFMTKLDLAHPRSIEYAQGFLKNIGKKPIVYELNETLELKKFFEIIDLRSINKNEINEDHHHEHHHHEHEHHDHHDHPNIEILNFETDKVLDLDKFQHFIKNELKSIIRAKGIIQCQSHEGKSETYTLQAVAERKEFSKKEKIENETTVLIIIGLGLDKDLITSRLEDCFIH